MGISDRFHLFYRNITPYPLRRFFRNIYFPIRYPFRHFSYLINKNKKREFDYNLAIAATVKNEAPYIKEWIEYHRIVGVDKFIIYDNESDDNIKEVLQPYIDSGIVDYTFHPGKKQQIIIYNKAVKKYKKKVKYLAIIDADEFIVPVKHNTIIEVINEVEEIRKKQNKPFAGLFANWVMFGYNGHYSKPEGLVTENYPKCYYTKHFKSIINPRMVINYQVHNGYFVFNYAAADEYGNDFIDFEKSIGKTIDKIRINHYVTRSYEEFKNKHTRGSAHTGTFEWKVPEYDPEYYSKYDDKTILRFLPLLKNNLSQ